MWVFYNIMNWLLHKPEIIWANSRITKNELVKVLIVPGNNHYDDFRYNTPDRKRMEVEWKYLIHNNTFTSQPVYNKYKDIDKIPPIFLFEWKVLSINEKEQTAVVWPSKDIFYTLYYGSNQPIPLSTTRWSRPIITSVDELFRTFSRQKLNEMIDSLNQINNIL